MKRSLLVCVGLATLCVSAYGQNTSKEFKAYIVALMPRVEKAFASKSTAEFEKMSTKDFTETMNGETMNRSQALAAMKKEFATVKSCVAKLKLDSATAKGSTGIAMTSGKITMMMKPDAKGKSHALAVQMWEKQTWVRDGKEWKLKKLEHVKPMKMTYDGRSMPEPSVVAG